MNLLRQSSKEEVINFDAAEGDPLVADGALGLRVLEAGCELTEEGTSIKAGQMVAGARPHRKFHPFRA